jgi:exonuclease-1
MLSGCDYLDSIPGIGLKTAHKLLRRHKTVEKVVQMIKLEGTLHVPNDYIKAFAQAELAFIHQRVYDPALKKLVPLNEFPQGGLKDDDEKWVGLDMEPEVARGIAEGTLHPETGIVLEDICPDYQPVKRDVQKACSDDWEEGADGRCLSVLDQESKSLDLWTLLYLVRPASFLQAVTDISGSKAPKSKPLPTPVGQFGSGVSRLSDRNLNIADEEDLPIGITKKSKFFARTKRSPAKPVQLKWESSQEPILIDMDDDEETIAAEPRRSPSACASPKYAENDESFNHLTSPAAPELSSPAVSSPPRGETFTTPRPERDTLSRSQTPVSPTRPGKQIAASVLIPSTSQIVISHPLSSSAPNRLQGGLGTSTYSNFDSSSDTIDLEEVVTPSFEVGRRTVSNTSLGKRSRIKEEVEVDEVELERAEKAKVIAHDWKLKYAFGANVSPL